MPCDLNQPQQDHAAQGQASNSLVAQNNPRTSNDAANDAIEEEKNQPEDTFRHYR